MAKTNMAMNIDRVLMRVGAVAVKAMRLSSADFCSDYDRARANDR